MIFQVLKGTCENKVNNDFVHNRDKYFEKWNIMWSFEDILKLSYISFKKILKERSKKATFDYLISEKGQQKKNMHINKTK